MYFCNFISNWALSFTEDESSGLYGFLNVIVHSASGLKQNLSKWLVSLFYQNRITNNSQRVHMMSVKFQLLYLQGTWNGISQEHCVQMLYIGHVRA